MVLWYVDPHGVGTSTFVTLLLSLVGGATVLYVNAKARRRLREEHTGLAPHQQAVHARILLISTLLAILAVINAGVAYGSPKGLITVQPTANGPFVSLQAPALWAALLIVCVLALVVASEAYVIWQAYVSSVALTKEEIAPWKSCLVHCYLLVTVAAWLLNHVPYQIERRRSPVLPGLNSDAVLSVAWILLTFVGHVFFYAAFAVAAFGSLNGSSEQSTARASGGYSQVLAERRRLAVRSLVYIASSLVAYIMVWLAAVLRPLDMQLDVTVGPYCLVTMLLCHGCFVASSVCSSPPTEAAEEAAAFGLDREIAIEEHGTEEAAAAAAAARLAVFELPSLEEQRRWRRQLLEERRRGAAPGMSSTRVASTVSGLPSSSAGYQTQSLQSLVPASASSKASSSSSSSSRRSGGKSQRSQSSSLSSKTHTSGDAAVIAIPPISPDLSPGLSRRQHWADLFSARRQHGQPEG